MKLQRPCHLRTLSADCTFSFWSSRLHRSFPQLEWNKLGHWKVTQDVLKCADTAGARLTKTWKSCHSIGRECLVKTKSSGLVRPLGVEISGDSEDLWTGERRKLKVGAADVAVADKITQVPKADVMPLSHDEQVSNYVQKLEPNGLSGHLFLRTLQVLLSILFNYSCISSLVHKVLFLYGGTKPHQSKIAGGLTIPGHWHAANYSGHLHCYKKQFVLK